MSRTPFSRLLSRYFQRDQPKTDAAALPEGLRIYAIGDVHGCLDLLKGVWERIDQDLKVHPVDEAVEIFLGDYIDRGPDSCGVIEALSSPAPDGRRRVCLRGNHEQMLLSFLDNPAYLEMWRPNGALETLVSYGVDARRLRNIDEAAEVAAEFLAKAPASHVAFLRSLPFYVDMSPYFFVHAGIRPGIAPTEQREEDMLWIRDAFLRSDMDFGRILVHGHTPVEQPERRHNRINIDTGAYLTGKLTCVALEGSEVRFL